MQKLDFIISDISMPHMDGYQFIQAVRNLLPGHKGKHPPALALTAFSRPQDRVRALDAGFQAHLSKPVSFEVLVETIMSIVNRAITQLLKRGQFPLSSFLLYDNRA